MHVTMILSHDHQILGKSSANFNRTHIFADCLMIDPVNKNFYHYLAVSGIHYRLHNVANVTIWQVYLSNNLQTIGVIEDAPNQNEDACGYIFVKR